MGAPPRRAQHIRCRVPVLIFPPARPGGGVAAAAAAAAARAAPQRTQQQQQPRFCPVGRCRGAGQPVWGYQSGQRAGSVHGGAHSERHRTPDRLPWPCVAAGEITSSKPSTAPYRERPAWPPNGRATWAASTWRRRRRSQKGEAAPPPGLPRGALALAPTAEVAATSGSGTADGFTGAMSRSSPSICAPVDLSDE